MPQDKLLQLLVERGFLNARLADKVESDSKDKQVAPEDLIFEGNLVRDEEVIKIKSEIIGIPYRSIDVGKINPEVLRLIPADTARTYKVFPISKDKDMLVVGMLHPEDDRAKEALRFIAKQLKVNLGAYLVTPSSVETALKRYDPFQSEVDEALAALNLPQQVTTPGPDSQQSMVILDDDRTVIAGEAPIIRIVSQFLKEAVRLEASDVHFEPGRHRMKVRFRVDGALKTVSSVPIAIYAQIISRLKVLSKLKIDERRVPQDGRFRTNVFNREIDFRIATFPTPFGEKAAVRVLDPRVGLKGLSELGVTGRSLEMIQEGIRQPYGLILMTGPTGSGKTTTLYGLMQILNKEDVNIVSLEDPVEYSIEGTNQSQVKPEIGYTFASGLRQILRQDPDVVMIGEIRDPETASLVTHAALTGHIVLSTLHTNNAVGVIPRIINLDVPSFLLPSTINLMMAQRLVARLCPDCKESVTPSPEIKKIIDEELAALPEGVKSGLPQEIKIFQSKGCAACNQKGTKGRLAIVEVFKMTPNLADVISDKVNENDILKEAQRQGMVSLRQDGILKALEGLVRVEDVLRETQKSLL